VIEEQKIREIADDAKRGSEKAAEGRNFTSEN
jgi:hypothetical protein